MFVKMNSTRHTALGTLRMGTTYELPDNSQKVNQTLEPLLSGENPVAVILTAEEVKAERASVESLMPKADEDIDRDAADELAEFEARLNIKIEECDAAIKRAEAAEAKVEALEKELEDARAQIANLTEAASAEKTDAKPSGKAKG